MALTNLVTSLVLDVYDHDTTPTSVKAIALDKQTRFIKATLTYRGADYPVDENATVTLTVIRPDKTGVQVTGSVVDVDNADRTGTIKGVYAELTQAALAKSGTLRAQFKMTVGEQILRTEIFQIKNGIALDEETSEWTDQYEGYNLDELVQNVNSAVATVEEMQSDVTDLKRDLINNLKHLNSYNYLTDYSIETYGTGVTCSRTSDGGINLSGTCDGLYFVNFYANKTQMPSNLIAGKTYTAIFSGENVVFNVYFYKNGSYLAGLDITTTRQFTIPSDATGAIIRLAVSSGITVNETVYPFIIDNTSLLYKGAITNDFDIGTITETGVYLLTGNTSSPVSHGTLMHLEASQYVRIQILFEMADLKIWYRRWLSGTWYPWQTYGVSGFYAHTKYIAFGDSLMYGALWNGTPEDPIITQASLGSRIPDRIKNAIKCATYNNYAVGGMAYTIKNGNIPKFIDWIKSKDISTADLITIAGGRNDGASQLGNFDSESGDGTICGAIREIIEYIRETNPSCQIVVIQVTPYTSTNNPFDSQSTSGWTLNTFDEQVSKLCKDMNVGYANWYGCSLFSRWTDFSGGGGNYAHMREEEQYIQMGNFIAGQVARFYQN